MKQIADYVKQYWIWWLFGLLILTGVIAAVYR